MSTKYIRAQHQIIPLPELVVPSVVTGVVETGKDEANRGKILC